jgi:F0F1-type ATP synthase membrane subunit b/b'
MAFTQSSTQGKQNEPAAKIADAAKANLNQGAEQAAQANQAARDGLNTVTDLHAQATETGKKMLQDGVETAAKQVREASDRLTRTFGFSGQDGERLARQSKQNLEAVTRCGTTLTQAFQDASRNWFELAQKQWQRNLEGMNKLARSQSLQEFTAIQAELVREGLQQMVQDSRGIAETSLRAVDDASKAFPGLAQQSPSPTH